MHVLAALVAHQRVAQAGAERLTPVQHGRHHQQRVEPVAVLAGEALGDEVRRVPLLPDVGMRPVPHGGERHDAGVQPGVADVRNARDRRPALAAPDFHSIDPWPVRRVTLEVLPPRHRSRSKLLRRCDDVHVAAFRALVDRERQTPVPLLADHPVVHVAQPVQLAVQAEVWDPVDPLGDLFELLTHGIHGDEPLVYQPEDEFGLAAPADRIAVGVRLDLIEPAGRAQVLDDRLRRLTGLLADERPKAVDEHAKLIDRGNHRKPVFLAQRKVFRAAAGGDVHDAGAFLRADILPRNHMVLDAPLRWQVIERTAIPRPDQPAAGQPLDDRVVSAQRAERAFGQHELLSPLAHHGIDQVRMHGRRHVAGEGPRRGGPHQQRSVRTVDKWKPEEHSRVGLFLVPFRDDLVLTDAGRAAGTPGHNIMALVDHPALPALLEERPDLIVVLVGEGKIRAPELGRAQLTHELFGGGRDRPAAALHTEAPRRICAHRLGQPAQQGGILPIHPHPQPDRLLRDLRGVRQHAFLAEIHKRPDAERLDVALAAKA